MTATGIPKEAAGITWYGENSGRNYSIEEPHWRLSCLFLAYLSNSIEYYSHQGRVPFWPSRDLNQPRSHGPLSSYLKIVILPNDL